MRTVDAQSAPLEVATAAGVHRARQPRALQLSEEGRLEVIFDGLLQKGQPKATTFVPTAADRVVVLAEG